MKENTSSFKIEKPKKNTVPLLCCLYGEAGSGKTWSSLLLAQEFTNTGNIGIVDTENQRGSLYCNDFNFSVINMSPPFTPQKFIGALQAFKKEGYDVVIIDSISEVWDGQGGCMDMADSSTAKGFNKWNGVKKEYAALFNMIKAADIHIIINARAKRLTSEEGSDKGITYIGEKNMFYPLSCVFKMLSGGKFEIIKTPHPTITNAIQNESRINTKVAKCIKDFLSSGEDVDITSAQQYIDNGDLEGLRKWFQTNLNDNERRQLNMSGIAKKMGDECKANQVKQTPNADNNPSSDTKIPVEIPEDIPNINN
jgi:hypothetical protein